jgi:hypothetical protein
MGVLLSTLWEGRYHSGHALERGHREAAGGGSGPDAGQAGGGVGHEAFDAGGQPHHTGMADALLGRHTYQGQREPVEGMRRVDDLDRLTREKR